MSFLSAISKPVAVITSWKLRQDGRHAIEAQEHILHQLLKNGRDMAFGRDHQFPKIQSYEDFKNHVPVRDYEALNPYITSIMAGECDVLWPGKPLYLSKTSGTTSGAKYI